MPTNHEMMIDVAGTWLAGVRRDRECMKLAPGGVPLVRTPGMVIVPARARSVEWVAAAHVDANAIARVAESSLASRITAVSLTDTELSDEILCALSNLSPALAHLGFLRCRSTGVRGSLRSARTRSISFSATDPRCVGELPMFLTTIVLHDVGEALVDDAIAHAVRANPRNLHLRTKPSMVGVASALCALHIRVVGVWGNVDGPLLASLLSDSLGLRKPGRRSAARVLDVRGEVVGRAALEKALEAYGVRLRVQAPRRGR